ncbi:hypothetical protein [Thermococcus prieurii]
MRRNVEKIRRLVLAGPLGEGSEWTLRSIHGSRKWGHRRKLRIDELYAMFLAKKPYNQLTKLDKEMAREDLARKVLKYYFSSSWGRGYFQLLSELEDFYAVFPRAGRDKTTFVRFIRSLSVVELKRVFTAEPDTLFQAVLWLERNKNKAKRGGMFGEFYQRVLKAVSELQSDKWSKKLVKAVFLLVKEVKPYGGFPRKETLDVGSIVSGRKELGFYDYFALYLIKECRVAPVVAFTAAVLTTRHIIAEYFFDPWMSYRQRLIRIREHFKPLFSDYPQAEAFLDDYFIRGVIKSFSWQDLLRFTGVDVEKLERYYHKNKHKFSLNTKLKVLKAVSEYRAMDRDKLKDWWNEHSRALTSLTSLCSS